MLDGIDSIRVFYSSTSPKFVYLLEAYWPPVECNRSLLIEHRDRNSEFILVFLPSFFFIIYLPGQKGGLMNGGIVRKAPNTLAFSLMIYKRISQAGTEFLDSMRLAEVSCLSLWAHLGKTRQGGQVVQILQNPKPQNREISPWIEKFRETSQTIGEDANCEGHNFERCVIVGPPKIIGINL